MNDRVQFRFACTTSHLNFYLKVHTQFIDTDLAGPNYRGFDTMKLFRTDDSLFNDNTLLSFLKVYGKVNDNSACQLAGRPIVVDMNVS